ncbi:hypothetical protein F4777DRAFT_528566 [Nemania sp. FL0916]|nr:hypothetical protein F4777DRAFT_528566 [Nemania sp. FL0916]
MTSPKDVPTPAAVEKARQLVNRINEEKGFLSEEDLNAIGPPDYGPRRKVEIAMLRKDKLIGSGVLTLAKNLYTSNARFVFELLQNADDNNFSRAIARGEVPYISFRIFPDKIILECNEDGFTPENLQAICAIGQSSKVGAQGYIGEKGIGFKSVFMAAWRVHIQSNAFSFTFTHRKGDSGMGMVSPVWQEPEAPMDASITRITLSLHQYDDADMQKRDYSNIVSQFNKLQGTSLLFLRKLRQIRVSFCNREGSQTSGIEHSLHGSDRVTIRKTSGISNVPKTVEDRIYHVTKHIARNVPANENRSYSSDQHRTDAETEIVLAFPLTEDSIPIDDENQDIYAFLPLRTMGFKFLMHTDFVTEASRQGIVTTSRRNLGLRADIADCFIKAVKQFCQDSTLQFQWMRWIPRRDTYPWDDFWNGLLDMVDRRIKESSIFRRRTDNQLTTLSSLRMLHDGFLDEKGNPLFRDTSSPVYISGQYTKTDLNLVKPFGLTGLSVEEIIGLVWSDFRDGSSRLRGTDWNSDWYRRVATQLLSCMEKGTIIQQGHIRALGIVPLSTGERTSVVTDGPLYYHRCRGGIQIPDGLGLKLVSPTVMANSELRRLFDKFGVLTAPIQLVQLQIATFANKFSKVDGALLQTAVSHLAYLYLTHDHKDGKLKSDYFDKYHVYNVKMDAQNPREYITYLPTSDPQEPLELLRGQGYEDTFIHDAYLKGGPQTPLGKLISWVDWICKSLNIRRSLRLVFPDTTPGTFGLASELSIVSAKCPDKLVGALQKSWPEEGKYFDKNPKLVDEMRNLKVMDKYERKIPLGEAYLPLPELEASFSRFAEGEKFPFLQLTEPIESGTYKEKWGFLVDVLEVGYIKDVNFYLDVLISLRRCWQGPSDSVKRPLRYLELYKTIQGSCQTSDNEFEAQDMVIASNNKYDCIFIPAHGPYSNDMVGRRECVWVGHENLQTVRPLESIYKSKFGLAEADMETLKKYFHTILEIPNCSWEHYVNEIRELKSSTDIDFDWVNDLYHFIDQERKEFLFMGTDKLRAVFSNEPLIYANTSGSSCWHTVSQCVWSSATQIQGRVALNDTYPDLRNFLVDFLGVTPLTLELAYGELKVKGNSDPAPPIEEVKDTIFAFNSLLHAREASDKIPDPKKLAGCKFLPVRYPTADGNYNVKLADMSTDFAIVDRQLLNEAFAPMTKLLDFSLEETRELGPFIDWLGFRGRYLSVAVKEITTIAVDSDTTRPMQNPERKISRRAHGLLRIAMHNNSPRTRRLSDREWLYEKLRLARVLETDGISSELHLSQDGRDLKYVKEVSELHISEEPDHDLERMVLAIYVPRDMDRQNICYFETLPARLLEWLMTDEMTNIKTPIYQKEALDVVNSIINAPERSISQILVARGIVDADVAIKDDDDDGDGESVTLHNGEGSLHDGALEEEQQEDNEERGGEAEDVVSITQVSSRHAITLPTRPRYQSHDVDPEVAIAAVAQRAGEFQTDYVRLLSHVISRARLATFPRQGIFAGLADANVPFGESANAGTGADSEGRRLFHSRVPLERDMKIGAAGELFVFELLSRLDPSLPGFGRDNWQSTIRKFATSHPDYTDMQPWSGRETADIVYSDHSGSFTELLLNKGYLQGNRRMWEQMKLNYMIEVKTTTQSVETPFFVSKRQFQRMNEHTGFIPTPFSSSPTIYMILRVFNVDNNSIGVKVYMDPEKLRRDNLLVFTELGYSVTPRASAD